MFYALAAAALVLLGVWLLRRSHRRGSSNGFDKGGSGDGTAD